MKLDSKEFLVEKGEKLKLKKHDPSYTSGFKGEEEAALAMKEDLAKLKKLQEKLYAGGRHSVLIILQAMDAAGKDGVIKHVMSGLNPQGCKVTSFKHPSNEEYVHDFLWRHVKALPESGQIGIFNRSHYENVLVCRVHPELVLNERLPEYDEVTKLDEQFWQHRFRQIRRFEKNLVQNGMLILKFFLNVSKEEQRRRLLSRIDNKDKQWKFSFTDINERKHWDDYQECYRDVLEATSTKHAPWYIIPADHKWYTRAVIADLLVQHFDALGLQYPELPEAEAEKLVQAKALLLKEQQEKA
jgi:PPK2 family polyphosphate:nucleotide phosphotransferase